MSLGRASCTTRSVRQDPTGSQTVWSLAALKHVCLHLICVGTTYPEAVCNELDNGNHDDEAEFVQETGAKLTMAGAYMSDVPVILAVLYVTPWAARHGMIIATLVLLGLVLVSHRAQVVTGGHVILKGGRKFWRYQRLDACWHFSSASSWRSSSTRRTPTISPS